MHKHDPHVTYDVMEKVQAMFMNSPHGQAYRQEYERINQQRQQIEHQYMELNKRMEPAFKKFVESM